MAQTCIMQMHYGGRTVDGFNIVSNKLLKIRRVKTFSARDLHCLKVYSRLTSTDVEPQPRAADSALYRAAVPLGGCFFSWPFSAFFSVCFPIVELYTFLKTHTGVKDERGHCRSPQSYFLCPILPPPGPVCLSEATR